VFIKRTNPPYSGSREFKETHPDTLANLVVGYKVKGKLTESRKGNRGSDLTLQIQIAVLSEGVRKLFIWSTLSRRSRSSVVLAESFETTAIVDILLGNELCVH
jgi:hypothetical protein